MKEFTSDEKKMFNRYQRSSVSKDKFLLLQSSALASNKLIGTIEETFKGKKITAKQYRFLAMLSERRTRNYKALSGAEALVKFFEAVSKTSFEQIKIEEI